MSFNIFERSRAKAKPFYLLMIRYGPGANDFYAFTDGDFPFVKGGVTYEVRAFDLSEIVTTGSLDRSSVTLSTPRTNELFDLFRIYPPSYRVTMTVMKSHFGDADQGVVTLWSGRILAMTVKGSECEFNCEPIATTMKRLGLRRNWQYGCPHALYQGDCKANKAAVQRSVVVVAVGSGTLTLAGGWNGPFDASKYIGGYVDIPVTGSPAQARSILRINANTLTLSGSTSNASVGGTVLVYPGCAHDMGDCKAVHNNIVNFGGQAWIPTNNPVGSKNNFY